MRPQQTTRGWVNDWLIYFPQFACIMFWLFCFCVLRLFIESYDAAARGMRESRLVANVSENTAADAVERFQEEVTIKDNAQLLSLFY